MDNENHLNRKKKNATKMIRSDSRIAETDWCNKFK